MRNAIRSAQLRFVYARYATSRGWNDHPMAVRQRVELYMELGAGPVAEAVAHFTACRRRWTTCTLRGAFAAGLLCLGAYAAYHASPAAAEVTPRTPARPAESETKGTPNVMKPNVPLSRDTIR